MEVGGGVDGRPHSATTICDSSSVNALFCVVGGVGVAAVAVVAAVCSFSGTSRIGFFRVDGTLVVRGAQEKGI